MYLFYIIERFIWFQHEQISSLKIVIFLLLSPKDAWAVDRYNLEVGIEQIFCPIESVRNLSAIY